MEQEVWCFILEEISINQQMQSFLRNLIYLYMFCPPQVLVHSCVETIEQVYSLGLISTVSPWPVPMPNGLLMEAVFRKAGYVCQPADDFWALPSYISAQTAESITLTRALQLGTGLRININTDFKYGFLVLHTHCCHMERKGTTDSQRICVSIKH